MQCHLGLCTEVFYKSSLALFWDKCGAPRDGAGSQLSRLEPRDSLGKAEVGGDGAVYSPAAEAQASLISGSSPAAPAAHCSGAWEISRS